MATSALGNPKNPMGKPQSKTYSEVFLTHSSAPNMQAIKKFITNKYKYQFFSIQTMQRQHHYLSLIYQFAFNQALLQQQFNINPLFKFSMFILLQLQSNLDCQFIFSLLVRLQLKCNLNLQFKSNLLILH